MCQVRRLVRFLPFALAQCPACDDPERDHEDKQHRAGTNGHQRLQHEPGVEVDPVESPDAARAGVGEQLGMEQHDPEQKVHRSHGKFLFCCTSLPETNGDLAVQLEAKQA